MEAKRSPGARVEVVRGPGVIKAGTIVSLFRSRGRLLVRVQFSDGKVENVPVVLTRVVDNVG